MSPGIAIDQLPRRYQDQIAAQMAARKPIAYVPTPRIKQERKTRTSKLETRYGEHLKTHKKGGRVYPQFALAIANGTKYYVDFMLVIEVGNNAVELDAFEVKGPYARANGITKLKVAAHQYPWIRFWLVSEVDGAWVEERVLS